MCPPPLSLFVKTIGKEIRLCTVLKKTFLSAGFEDMAIFHGIQVSYDYGGGALSALYRSIDKFVKNAHTMSLSLQPPLKRKISTQCIISLLFLLFSQIKIGGGHFEPPPPLKLRSENSPSKVRLNE